MKFKISGIELEVIGAIAGDIIGSVFEYYSIKSTDFPLFSANSTYTDDTVLTIAIADCILNSKEYAPTIKEYGRSYPYAGYGVSKLHLQVSRLREALQDYSVHGVIVTPLDRGDLLVWDVEDCEAESINLVLRPELTQMLQVVSGRDWPRARQTIIQILTRGSSTASLI